MSADNPPRRRLRQWADEVRTKLAAVEDYYRARG